MKIIDLKNVSFSYDENTIAVNNVSFSVEKGTYTTIIGHNGSGKSTIAKLLIGLLAYNSGNINIAGLNLELNNLNAIRKKVGIVFQNPDNQFIGATVRDDIAFGLENHCVLSSDMDKIINEYAKKVGMQDYLDFEPTKLSGGQKQRVAIAGVLAMSPELIIFDESTSMLDPQGKNEINELIKQLHNDKQMTILSITHDIEEVCKSDRVIVMHEGQVLMEGKPIDILVNHDKLISCDLDIPFAQKIVMKLRVSGIKIENCLTIESLVKELCRLNLKQ